MTCQLPLIHHFQRRGVVFKGSRPRATWVGPPAAPWRGPPRSVPPKRPRDWRGPGREGHACIPILIARLEICDLSPLPRRGRYATTRYCWYLLSVVGCSNRSISSLQSDGFALRTDSGRFYVLTCALVLLCLHSLDRRQQCSRTSLAGKLPSPRWR